MKKRLIITLIFLSALFGGLIGFNIFKGHMIRQVFDNFPEPTVTVTAETVKTSRWTDTLSTIGNLKARQGVDITAETTGNIRAILFNSGQRVSTDTPLVQIDDAIEQATLKDNLASLKLAELDFKRQTDLLKRGAAPSSAVDAARAKLQSTTAMVEKTKAVIAQKLIKAPFNGRLGIRQVNVGEYVTPGQTVIVSLQNLDPLMANFSLPEQAISQLAVGQQVNIKVDAHPNKIFTGKIHAIEPSIDLATHTVNLQATIPNASNLLLPGFFAQIEIILGQERDVITVPKTAVVYSLYGDSVYIVKTETENEDEIATRAHQQFVKTGPTRGNRVVITQGLNLGDQVIDAGQLKLQNGAKITVK